MVGEGSDPPDGGDVRGAEAGESNAPRVDDLPIAGHGKEGGEWALLLVGVGLVDLFGVLIGEGHVEAGHVGNLGDRCCGVPDDKPCGLSKLSTDVRSGTSLGRRSTKLLKASTGSPEAAG